MKLSEIGERFLVGRIRERFGCSSRDVRVGIGDDAAVIIPRKQPLLLTTDMMTEGVHFDLGVMTWFQIGFKLISSNVSDVFAMGGIPRFVLLDLAVNKRTDDASLESFFDGVEKAMGMHSLRLIGGDLSSSGKEATVTATLIGYARRPVMRSGARPGDRIYVTGNLGDSACGFELLKIIRRPLAVESGEKVDKPLSWSVMGPLIRRHVLPEARRPGKIAGAATAMIDISDGLFMDLSRLCDESEVGSRIYMKHLPLSPRMKKAARALGADPYHFATSGGEDYELLFTVPPGRKVAGFCIGEITESERVFVDQNGRAQPLIHEGYEHWR